MRARFAIGLALILCLLGGLCTVPAGAELPDVVKRYVDDVTLVVTRVDVEEFSAEAIVNFVTELMREAPADERQRFIDNLRQGLALVEETLAPLRERGVTTAWFVAGPEMFVNDEPALMIVPAADEQQVAAVTELLVKQRQEHRKVEGAILVGPRPVLDTAANIRPVDRPALSAPIRIGRNAPALQIAFEPTPLVRIAAEVGARELMAQVPQLPPETPDLLAEFESLSLAVSLPPQPRAQLAVAFPNQESAERAREVVQKQIDMMEERFRRAEIDPERARQLTEAFSAEARAKRVVVELTDLELRDTVGPIMVMTMLRGREGGARIRAGNNLRKLSQGILLWTYEHGEGRLPPDLAAVEQVFTDPKVDGVTWRQVRRNPRFRADDAFAYVRPADRLDAIKEPEFTVIAYEKPPADGIREGLNVAFADGRVEWFTAEGFELLAKEQGFEIQRLPRQ